MGPAGEPSPVEEAPSGSGFTRRRKAGLVLGIVALVGAVVFAAFTLFLRDKSPEEIVDELFVALGEEDVLGAAASILPSERRFVVDPLLDTVDEAKRLGILADVDLEGIRGVDLAFDGLTYEVEALADDLVWVAVSGTVRSAVRPEDLPVGPLLLRFLPENWAEEISTDPIEDSSIEEAFGLALVKEDGDWYVSLTYTIAEAARREAQVPFPESQPFGEPRGAATPEQALERAVLAITNIDLRAFVDVLVPAQTAAFRRYAQLFIDDWDSGVADLRAVMAEGNFSYSVDEVVVGSARREEDTVAWVEDVPRFRAAIDIPEIGMLSIDRDGDCLKIEVPEPFIEAFGPLFGENEIDFSELDGQDCVESEAFGDTFTQEQSDPFQGQEELFFEMPIAGPLLERWLEPLENLSETGASAVQFEVEEVDGRWYVSPAGTLYRWMLAFTGTLDEALLTQVGDEIRQSVEEPEVLERRLEEWATKAAETGLFDPLGGFGAPPAGVVYGPETLAPQRGTDQNPVDAGR